LLLPLNNRWRPSLLLCIQCYSVRSHNVSSLLAEHCHVEYYWTIRAANIYRYWICLFLSSLADILIFAGSVQYDILKVSTYTCNRNKETRQDWDCRRERERERERVREKGKPIRKRQTAIHRKNCNCLAIEVDVVFYIT